MCPWVDERVADAAIIEPRMSVQYCLVKLCQRWGTQATIPVTIRTCQAEWMREQRE